MSIGSALYTLFIGPLKLLFEVVYTLAYLFTHNAGISIIALSLVMNVLLLPLYKRADEVQEKENEKQKELKKGVDHIKKSFKGDEQYLILSTYYRQNDYKPIYALRSSISLMLQIPFFIAAYDFLSNEYTVLSSAFGPISSLGNPDGLLSGVNVLPIAMTAINIISSIIYTKGQPFKSRIQLYIMALAFLVFLYNRPSGLVFYWTLNNLFSLIKNIFMKLKNARQIINVLLALSGCAGLIFVLFIHPMSSLIIHSAAIIISIALALPFVYDNVLKNRINLSGDSIKSNNSLFYAEIIYLSLYFGLFIPCQVIQISPSEFIDTVSITGPLVFIFNTLFLSLGTFCIWSLLYYSLMNNTVRNIIQYVLAVVCPICVIDYLFFGTDLGKMSNLLVYDNGMFYTAKEMFTNIAVVIIVFVVLSIIYFRKKNLFTYLMLILIIVVSLVSGKNIYGIHSETTETINRIRKAKENKAEIHLSKEGRNVVVIILDRAVNYYFPYIINEKEEILNSFAGFTYYPNTLSYSGETNIAGPSVYGGYEYIPDGMNARADEKLMDKHNEALKVMPVLFDENGFDVTVFDPAYANYRFYGDVSIYKDYPNIKGYNTEAGMFDYDPALIKDNLGLLNRNLFCFGITKSVPLFLQASFYNGGAYNSISRYETLYTRNGLEDLSSRAYVGELFIKSYVVLENMINITRIEDNDTDNFLLMYNNTTHEPVLLQEPDYEVRTNVNNYEYDKEHGYLREKADGEKIYFENTNQMYHYHANMVTYKELALWFDYLRENGVYDNTKIIIVSDHSANLMHDKSMVIDNIDVLDFNPILLFKDFDSDELLVDESFMTNADTITFALKDIVDDPVNPFTGNKITDDQKYAGYQHVISSEIGVDRNTGNTFLPGVDLEVKDDVRDIDNWRKKSDD